MKKIKKIKKFKRIKKLWKRIKKLWEIIKYYKRQEAGFLILTIIIATIISLMLVLGTK